MRIHYLQHVPFEDAAEIAVWANNRGHQLSYTRLYRGESVPPLDRFDWLIVMGGPMNIYEYDRYPWLVSEKTLIRQSIVHGKALLGVCLGAQLIADCLGGSVTRNPHREIGWYPVSLTASARKSPLLAGWPDRFVAFHWHGDTFQIPPGAIHVATSEGCRNQAFIYDNRVVGLQFHLEYSVESIRNMLLNCRDELQTGRYVQDADAIESGLPFVEQTRPLLYSLLDALEKNSAYDAGEST